MRKTNAILGPAIILLLLIHVISGAFQLYGLLPGGLAVRKVLSFILAAGIVVHAVIGIVLTVQTVRIGRQGGKTPLKGNERFWLGRISGLAMMLLILYHILTFTGSSGEVFRLKEFGVLQLAAHILLALAILLHLVSNIRPLFMALGIGNRKYLKDILVVLSVILLVCAAAFVFYYLRWNVLWRYRR